uniref:Uncharacterized protein n=1 Tax=Caenorhabditis tropicalis TaxID=1561998 RepID=A0A1I7UD80_9PELO
MSVADHVEAIKKEMASASGQIAANKQELDRARQDITQMQLQLQSVNQDTQIQAEIQKAAETTKRLQEICMKFLQTITDPSQQSQLAMEYDQITKSGGGGGGQQMPAHMVNAVAAAMQPHMMMRNPMMSAMQSPRVPGKGAVPNGAAAAAANNAQMNGMMHQMQMQAMAAQVQAQAMLHAQMFPGMQMMMPGILPGMPPGMAGLPGMMPPSSMAAMQQQYQQMAAAAAANNVAVSTPSRNPSTSGAASRTRTPLNQSATNSPRPTTEPTIKEEEPDVDVAVSAAAVTTAAPTIKQEENPTVAVA